ncbi:MAG: hypothetical protein HZC22_03630 [Rhodocyclales bacterium]|nr:hypothetical protein [Rhodocyclales bacterium]
MIARPRAMVGQPGRTAADNLPATLVAAIFLCGALMSVRLVVIGDLFAGEMLLLATAAATIVLRGVGPRFAPLFFWAFTGAGMLMLLGYAIADLVAVSSSAQYLRGWARIALFGLDFVALMLLVSHGERLLWWFALGLAIGMLGVSLESDLAFTLTNWKREYAFPTGLLVTLLSGLVSPLMAGVALGAFGGMTMMLDYRSLGGVYLLAAGVLGTRMKTSAWHRLGPLSRWSIVVSAMLVAVGLIAALLTQSDEEFHQRRLQSNIGRVAGIVVAVEAISDSPILGYGSWAGDKRYMQMLRSEIAKASAGKNFPGGRLSSSILPHSQVLQAWIEGGILAAAFFMLFGVSLLAGLRWLILHHKAGLMTPLYAMVMLNALWNILFSPFLGLHRIHVAFALAALSLLAWERRAARRQLALRARGS